jgi:Rod binding domain-containing protein
MASAITTTSHAGFLKGLKNGAAPTQHEQLRAGVQKWVGLTFFGTMLKQARQGPFHSNTFDGGRGGQAFGSMYDQQMAEHMARGAGNKLVNAIVKSIESKQALGKRAYEKAARDSRGAGNAPAGQDVKQLRSTHATSTPRT